MASKLLTYYIKAIPTRAACARYSSYVPEIYHDTDKEIYGKREHVGYGVNGMKNYGDRPDYPFPALRWKEEDSMIKAVREKEKGDWRKLTIVEKKCLYRFNFRQTIAEVEATGKGEIKSILGWTMIGIAFSLWCTILVRKLFLPPLPETMSLENRQAQLLRMLDFNMYAVTGISRDWDADKRRWKEK